MKVFGGPQGVETRKGPSDRSPVWTGPSLPCALCCCWQETLDAGGAWRVQGGVRESWALTRWGGAGKAGETVVSVEPEPRMRAGVGVGVRVSPGEESRTAKYFLTDI